MKIVIKKGEIKDFEEIIKIVDNLKEWFTKEAVFNIKIDCKVNSNLVAKKGEEVVGFLNYSAKDGKILLNWMAVKRDYQNKGIGKELIFKLNKIGKNVKASIIQVETLTEEDNYKPYEETRNFYQTLGFKKIYTKKAIKKGWDDLDVFERKIK